MHKEFQVHMLNETGKAKATAIAEAFDELLTKLVNITGEPSREMSLCRTKLEEASFFAKKAMAQSQGNTG
jgi:hypothetical protein